MLKRNDFVIKTISCLLFTYVCVHVYHEFSHTWSVYIYFRIFIVSICIGNDHVILFISRTKAK